MIVCVCHFVREEDVERAYRNGAWTPEAVFAATGAGSTCGCCRQFVEELVAAMDHPEDARAPEPGSSERAAAGEETSEGR